MSGVAGIAGSVAAFALAAATAAGLLLAPAPPPPQADADLLCSERDRHVRATLRELEDSVRALRRIAGRQGADEAPPDAPAGLPGTCGAGAP